MAIISVIIPTYMRAPVLRACLESLFADDLSGVKDVILVVHDQDPEGLKEANRWLGRAPTVRLAFTPHASRSSARNAAIPVAEGDWCYFLDDDCLVPRGTLRELERAIQAHPEASAVGGPNRIPEDCGLFERCVEEVLSSPLGAGTMRARYAGLAEEAWVDERSLIACNLAVRTSALRRKLLFHPWLDYGEETHFLAQLRLEGGRFLHDPRLWVYHRRRSGFAAFCQQAFRSGRGRARQTCLLPSSLTPEFLGPPALVLMLVFYPFTAPLLWLYAAACVVQGMVVGARLREPEAAVLTAALVPAGHLSFGLGCWLFPFSGPGWPSRAARWALRAKDVPGMSVLYRAYYAAALPALRFWLSLSGLPVTAMWLRRGMARNEVRPGVSDIDLAVELPDMSVDEELRWLDRWHAGLRALRRVFPIFGEVQLGAKADWSRYLSDGDVRSRELPGEARAVIGPGPAAPAPRKADDWSAAKSALDAWTEQLHAYVRLSQLYFDPDGCDERAALNARKAALDVSRYGRAAGPGWKAPSRAEQALATPDEGLEAACVRACALLEDSAKRALALIPGGAPAVPARPGGASAGEPGELAAFEAVCRELASATGEAVTGALHDNANHWLLGAARCDAPVWKALRALKGSQAALSQTLLPLLPASLRLALWSPYLEDPLRGFAVAGGQGRARTECSGATPLLRRHRLGVWNMDGAAPPRALADLMLFESLAHLLINWRALDEREDAYTRWAYAYGRVLSLRLHAKNGEYWGAFPLGPLAERFAEVFPEERGWIHDRVLGAEAIGEWAQDRTFIARQLRLLAAR